MAVTETKSATKVDPKTRTFLARLVPTKLFRMFRRFNGTPLSTALSIMGDKIHNIAMVKEHVKKDLNEQYLQRVPYTEQELRWGAKHNFVLTIVSVNMRSLVRDAGGDITIPPEIWKGSPTVMARRPEHPQWWLVSRPTTRSLEYTTLGLSQAERQRRLGLASAGIALTALYLDYAIHEIVPDRFCLTASPMGELNGDYSRRIAVGGRLRSSETGPVNVVSVRDGADYPAVITLKPWRLRH